MAQEFEDKKDDYSSILTKAIGDRLAEAFAESLHKQVRTEYYGVEENLTYQDLIDEKYQGIRPAAGYPSCPDHTEKKVLWDLMKVKEQIGVSLTETCAMNPPSSVSGYYFLHPDAQYFHVGKVDAKQVSDYAKRKSMTKQQIEKWLATNLSY